MTHSKAAGNKGKQIMRNKNETVTWGSTDGRWKKLWIKKNCPLLEGEQLRRMIRELIAGGNRQTPSPSSHDLTFKVMNMIEDRGEAQAVEIDSRSKT